MHRAEVAVGLEEGLRHALHQRCRRIVGHEAHGQLPRNEVRGGRMMRQDVQHLLAVLDAAAGRNRHAQHHLFAVVVQPRVEGELAAALRLVDGPAGEAARHFGDVLLRIAAVHAEGVQFQQLAAVVFVQAAALPFGGVAAGWWRGPTDCQLSR